MKYLIKWIFCGFLAISFIIGYVAQFLWTFKKPTISFKKIIDFANNFQIGDGPGEY